MEKSRGLRSGLLAGQTSLHIFLSTVIVKLIFKDFGIPSLKVEIVSFKVVKSICKLTNLNGLYRINKYWLP